MAESFVPVGIIILCLAGAAALIALVYVLVVAGKEIKPLVARINSLLDEVNALLEGLKPTVQRIDPLLDEVEEVLATTKPALERIDPLLERLTLTVDAANLEIMRVDQILEDVNTITGNVSNATASLDSITSVPLDALSSVTGKIRSRIAPLNTNQNARVATAANAVDQGLHSVETKIDTAQAENTVKQQQREEVVAAREAASAESSKMSTNIKGAVSSHISQDA